MGLIFLSERELTKTGNNLILMTTESHQRAIFWGVSWLDFPSRKFPVATRCKVDYSGSSKSNRKKSKNGKGNEYRTGSISPDYA